MMEEEKWKKKGKRENDVVLTNETLKEEKNKK